MKKQALFIVFCTLAVVRMFSQTIELDFPKMGGDTVRFSVFSGNRSDSFSAVLDAGGKALVTVPEQDYRGVMHISHPQKGSSEFIFAEPHLHITCAGNVIQPGVLQFPGSTENDIMLSLFRRRSYFAAQTEWLRAGKEYMQSKTEKPLYEQLLKENTAAVDAYNDSITALPYYSARYTALLGYMQNLYAAVQSGDSLQKETLKTEMETSLDIETLYRSGKLWNDIHRYYPNIFTSEEAYAASAGRVMKRLREPVMMAFLTTAAMMCERTSRPNAQEAMLRNFTASYPDATVTDHTLKLAIDALALGKGSKAPALTGLNKPLDQPAILVFFESGCGNCHAELDWLANNYDEVTEKGYRIITVAADMDKTEYLQAEAGFAWNKADRLCDFKGFEGENFKNYCIMGTPTIYVTDSAGFITGKYAKMSEVRL